MEFGTCNIFYIDKPIIQTDYTLHMHAITFPSTYTHEHVNKQKPQMEFLSEMNRRQPPLISEQNPEELPCKQDRRGRPHSRLGAQVPRALAAAIHDSERTCCMHSARIHLLTHFLVH